MLALAGLLGSSGLTASASAHASKSRIRYATVRRACSTPAPGLAHCLALALVPAKPGAAGARAYVEGAGSYSTGPAGGLTPADLASAYSFSPSAGGSGQTVAIVDAFDDPKIEADLGTFDANYGLAACTTANGCFTKVNQSGLASPLPEPDSGWGGEISLDVETVHSVCPSCKILLVEASAPDSADLAKSVNTAVALGATEVSNSYAFEEVGMSKSVQKAYDHAGVVITASSGDQGYLDWDWLFEGLPFPKAPNAPASLPTVVAVGGTSLTLKPSGAREDETVWNDSGPPSEPSAFKQYNATGSGCSTVFTAPEWQQNAPGWSNAACGTKRLTNDVAAVADPYTGIDIYDSYKEPGWITIGGTSLSSPLTSALYALAGGAHGVSYPARTLYEHLGQSSLFDVTQGGDGYCDAESNAPCGEPAINKKKGPIDCEGTTACDAAVGFDGPSGVGAPTGLGAFEPAFTGSQPTVLTGKATSVSASTAVLNATVNPNGGEVTTCTFEYGPAKVLGKKASCSKLPGSGTGAVSVSVEITGLSPSTKYAFRITAKNAAGASTGKEKTLKTKA
ncbi:MAG TPA: hypothetical protein VKG38_09575 [Solirubrobacteraceae bacterium]|nr:hypothetical protein [Solirubrobacteraceae bacterium]